jgi:nucleoside-diphosphate-sugar epimerase
MRVLVTGANGFIGSHLVHELLRRKVEVVALVRREISTDFPGVKWLVADLGEIDSLRQQLRKIPPCDQVFHFGARMFDQLHEKKPSSYFPANINATVLLLEQAASWSACSFVYASSLGIIGKPADIPITEQHKLNPATSYHLSKSMAEIACEFANRKGLLPVASLRITSPYGPGMDSATVISKFVSLAQQNKPLELFGTGQRTQNFVHVQDVVDASLAAADRSASGLFNIGGQRDISMRELAETVIRVVPGCRSVIQHVDRDDPQEHFRWNVALDKAQGELGYEPRYDIESGLRAMLLAEEVGL